MGWDGIKWSRSNELCNGAIGFLGSCLKITHEVGLAPPFAQFSMLFQILHYSFSILLTAELQHMFHMHAKFTLIADGHLQPGPLDLMAYTIKSLNVPLDYSNAGQNSLE